MRSVEFVDGAQSDAEIPANRASSEKECCSRETLFLGIAGSKDG